MGETTWSVVKFLNEDTVEAVPTSWLLGSNKCYWPPFPKEKVVNCIKKLESPNTCWPLHNVMIFRNATYDEYIVARNKARKAEDYSDLNSDTDIKSRKLKKKKNVVSSSDEENESLSKLPPPPKMFKTGKCNMESNTSIGPLQELLLTQNEQSVAHSSATKKTTEVSVSSCCCCADHKMGDTLKNLVKQQVLTRHLLTEILVDIRQIKQDLKTNTTPSAESHPVQSIFVTFEHFPISSEESLQLLEEHLSERKHFEAAVTEISKIGGSSPYDFMKRCLNSIFTNKFAAEYSWQGAKKKKVFGTLRVAELLLEAAQVSGISNRKSSEEAIKAWLRRAKERHVSACKKIQPQSEDTPIL